MPTASVDDRPLAAPRHGLIANAATPQDTTRWGVGGVAFTPELQCVAPGGARNPCDASADFTPSVNDPTVEWMPVVVSGSARCSTLGGDIDRQEQVAVRRMNADASHQLERELWEGAVASTATDADGNPWPNRWFTDGTADNLTANLTGGANLTHGFACLHQYLAETTRGQPGMIHATWQTVIHWWGLDLISDVGGGRLETPAGHVVVAGSGYTGASPQGAPAADQSIWAYATSMVTVRLGDPDPVTKVHDWETNTDLVLATRLAVASFDGCALGAVELALTPCDVGGAS